MYNLTRLLVYLGGDFFILCVHSSDATLLYLQVTVSSRKRFKSEYGADNDDHFRKGLKPGMYILKPCHIYRHLLQGADGTKYATDAWFIRDLSPSVSHVFLLLKMYLTTM